MPISVKDASGATVSIETPNGNGRQAAAASRPVALSTEDKAALDAVATAANQTAQTALLGAVTETAPGTDTASSGHNGRLQRIAQRLTSLIGLFPASIGQKTSAASLAVVVASDQSPVPVNILMTQGAPRNLTTTGSSVSTALTVGTKAITIYSEGSNAFFKIGNGSQTVSSTTGGFIASGERLEFKVSDYANPEIAVIFGSSGTSTVLRITELL